MVEEIKNENSEYITEGTSILDPLEQYLNLEPQGITKEQFIKDLGWLIIRDIGRQNNSYIAQNPFALSDYFSNERIQLLRELINKNGGKPTKKNESHLAEIFIIEAYMDIYNTNPLIFNYIAWYLSTYSFINNQTWIVKPGNQILKFEVWLPQYLKSLELKRKQQAAALKFDPKWMGIYQDLEQIGLNSGNTYGDHYLRVSQAKGDND